MKNTKIKSEYLDENGKITPIYHSWCAMRQRCNDKNCDAYKNYGGRGIKYSKDWESFSNFKRDMEGSYRPKLTLERIDNSLGYSKENCRWADRTEQANNKRNNRIIERNGERKTFRQWAEYLGIDYGTIRQRYYGGMSIDEILFKGLYRPRKLATK